MSGLNGKHLARVNQQLSGQPSRAPYGCAQLTEAVFPAELKEKPALLHKPNPCLQHSVQPFCGSWRRLHSFSWLLWCKNHIRREKRASMALLHGAAGCWCLYGRQQFRFPNGRRWCRLKLEDRCSVSETKCCPFIMESLRLEKTHPHHVH